MNNDNDERWMDRAIELAQMAEAAGEVPVGALLVYEGKIVGEGWNQPISSQDATAHAEIIALRIATSKLSNYRLPNDTSLYVTLEPCVMCAGAIIHARVSRVVFGASDPRSGAAGSVFNILDSKKLNHQVEIASNVMAARCSELLTDFFKQRR
ncbi:MAG: tRNA adenosine(34) deaminase TadA [Acidiferrobacterales bacterium]